MKNGNKQQYKIATPILSGHQIWKPFTAEKGVDWKVCIWGSYPQKGSLLAGPLSAPLPTIDPHKPAKEEGPPLLPCQLQRACLFLPQSFDTKIVEEVSVLKCPSRAWSWREWEREGKRKKNGKWKSNHTGTLEFMWNNQMYWLLL